MISPCKQVCTLDDTGKYCIGCYRTVEEITDWHKLPYIEKERIISECKIRETEKDYGS